MQLDSSAGSVKSTQFVARFREIQLIITVIVARMSHRKWRETKQQI